MSETKNTNRQFPQPAFPAQDAWKQMKEMLNKEMPAQRKRRYSFLWLFGVLIVGGIVLYSLHLGSFKEKLNDNVAVEKQNTASTAVQQRANNITAKDNTVIDEDIAVNEVDETANTFAEIKENTIVHKSHKILSNIKKAKHSKEFFVANNNENGYESFTDIQKLKARFEKKSNTNVSNNSHAVVSILPNAKEETSENVKTTTEIKKPITSVAKIASNATAITIPKPKYDKALHYGLQWNILLPQATSYLDYKAKQQPLTVVVPEFWVSKAISHKSELGIQLNPFSQYTINSNNVVETNKYPVTIVQGSGQTTTINYVQTRSLVKSMGIELTAKYTYNINKNLSASLGLGNNWVNAAVINDRIIGKGETAVRDSLYGIAKSFKEWDYLKSSFLVGRFEALYQLKGFQLGIAFLKPLGNIYTFSNSNNNPVNGRLVLRWMIK